MEITINFEDSGTFHEVFDEFVTSKKAQGVADATLNNYKYHLIVLYILPYQEQKKRQEQRLPRLVFNLYNFNSGIQQKVNKFIAGSISFCR